MKLWPVPIHNTIVRMLAQGATWPEIGLAVGKDKSTVRHYSHAHKLCPRNALRKDRIASAQSILAHLLPEEPPRPKPQMLHPAPPRCPPSIVDHARMVLKRADYSQFALDTMSLGQTMRAANRLLKEAGFDQLGKDPEWLW